MQAHLQGTQCTDTKANLAKELAPCRHRRISFSLTQKIKTLIRTERHFTDRHIYTVDTPLQIDTLK